ncbi:MAG: haloacid dehalogenase type II [Aliidongia sp.]
MAIRALVFDAYGTLYDVQSVRGRAIELCGEKGELVTQLWRLKQLEYTWLRSLMRAYEDLWPVTRAALEYSLTCVGIAPEPALCDRLMDKYLSLDLYPEAAEALDALRGYKLAILSNGSPPMLDALIASAGLTGRFADVISVDRVRSFKPDPACYALVEPALGVATEEILFVSSNGFDIAGAKRHGFNVARIARSTGTPAPENSDIAPAEFYRLLRGQAEQLGHAADWRVARLTDLAPLLASLAR